MLQVYRVRADRRPEMPAVVHVDSSGRLQTVTPAQNPRYHRLIEAFEERTGVPILPDTAFENEPVLCRPAEAIECFLLTRMDVLVLGEHLVARATPGAV